FLPLLQLVSRRLHHRPFRISINFGNGRDFFRLDPRLVPPKKEERLLVGFTGAEALKTPAAIENV
ncbi:hypothetical protein Csa_001349, partial [Cucumis sativus]